TRRKALSSAAGAYGRARTGSANPITSPPATSRKVRLVTCMETSSVPRNRDTEHHRVLVRLVLRRGILGLEAECKHVRDLDDGAGAQRRGVAARHDAAVDLGDLVRELRDAQAVGGLAHLEVPAADAHRLVLARRHEHDVVGLDAVVLAQAAER